MTSEEIKNMSFEDFRTQIEGMEEVQKLTADGTERYGIYKHDVCYVNRDGIERTLQMIVPETNAKAPKIYPAILYVQGSAWRKQDNYKRLGAMADLAKTWICDSDSSIQRKRSCYISCSCRRCKDRCTFLKKTCRGISY